MLLHVFVTFDVTTFFLMIHGNFFNELHAHVGCHYIMETYLV